MTIELSAVYEAASFGQSVYLAPNSHPMDLSMHKTYGAVIQVLCQRHDVNKSGHVGLGTLMTAVLATLCHHWPFRDLKEHMGTL